MYSAAIDHWLETERDKSTNLQTSCVHSELISKLGTLAKALPSAAHTSIHDHKKSRNSFTGWTPHLVRTQTKGKKRDCGYHDALQK